MFTERAGARNPAEDSSLCFVCVMLPACVFVCEFSEISITSAEQDHPGVEDCFEDCFEDAVDVAQPEEPEELPMFLCMPGGFRNRGPALSCIL